MERKICRLCGSGETKLVLEFPPSAIADSYSEKALEDQDQYKMDIVMCQNCKHVQCVDILDKKLLFNDAYTYSPRNSAATTEHFERYSELLELKIGKAPRKTLDIGSNDGLFLEMIRTRYGAQVLGVDPALSAVDVAAQHGISTIKGFFGSELAEVIKESHGTFDHISANNVFAHSAELEDITAGISSLLTEEGVFSFEFSYLRDIFEKTLVGAFFHEHVSHHSLIALMPFLEKFGLKVYDAERVSSQGGALIGFARKTKNEITVTEGLRKLIEEEKAIGLDDEAVIESMGLRIAAQCSEFDERMKSVEEGSRIIAYGAARSLNLFNVLYGLEKYVDFIVDSNPGKIGKYLSGTSLEVKDEKSVSFTKGDVVIVTAWAHTENIVKRFMQEGRVSSIVSLWPSVSITKIGNR